MELKQIQYFEVVYKNQSFSKAAQELRITQQCVSKSIQKLEQELGVKLFIRSSAGVEATTDGEYFHDQATDLLNIQDTIIDHFSSVKNDTLRTLHVEISRGLRFFFNEKYFLGFRQSYPDIQLQIKDQWNSQAEEHVLDNTSDIAFTLASEKQPKLTTLHIWKEPIYCIVNENHRLAGCSSLHMDDILDDKIILADENYNSYYNFQNICRKKNKTPDTVKTMDLMSIYAYVLHNNAVGFTLKSYIDVLHFQGIKHIPLNDPEAYWDICLIYKDSTKVPAISKFVQYTQKYIAAFF